MNGVAETRQDGITIALAYTINIAWLEERHAGDVKRNIS
jgi:hypothetical protein